MPVRHMACLARTPSTTSCKPRRSPGPLGWIIRAGPGHPVLALIPPDPVAPGCHAPCPSPSSPPFPRRRMGLDKAASFRKSDFSAGTVVRSIAIGSGEAAAPSPEAAGKDVPRDGLIPLPHVAPLPVLRPLFTYTLACTPVHARTHAHAQATRARAPPARARASSSSSACVARRSRAAALPRPTPATTTTGRQGHGPVCVLGGRDARAGSDEGRPERPVRS